jgi:oxalate decarboxylase/phosphoglucose isomerase-like protein (cupin superfamily)
VTAGDFVHVPRGTLHSTSNTGWRQLRVIAVYTPGGAEQALREPPGFTALTPGVQPVWERAR